MVRLIAIVTRFSTRSRETVGTWYHAVTYCLSGRSNYGVVQAGGTLYEMLLEALQATATKSSTSHLKTPGSLQQSSSESILEHSQGRTSCTGSNSVIRCSSLLTTIETEPGQMSG